MPEIGFT